jgi:hypothetical protein
MIHWCHISMGFDSCTTSSQQLHNNPSHEGGPQCIGPTFMWGVVVPLLYWCCKSNIFLFPKSLTENFPNKFQLYLTTNYLSKLKTFLACCHLSPPEMLLMKHVKYFISYHCPEKGQDSYVYDHALYLTNFYQRNGSIKILLIKNVYKWFVDPVFIFILSWPDLLCIKMYFVLLTLFRNK